MVRCPVSRYAFNMSDLSVFDEYSVNDVWKRIVIESGSNKKELRDAFETMRFEATYSKGDKSSISISIHYMFSNHTWIGSHDVKGGDVVSREYILSLLLKSIKKDDFIAGFSYKFDRYKNILHECDRREEMLMHLPKSYSDTLFGLNKSSLDYRPSYSFYRILMTRIIEDNEFKSVTRDKVLSIVNDTLYKMEFTATKAKLKWKFPNDKSTYTLQSDICNELLLHMLVSSKVGASLPAMLFFNVFSMTEYHMSCIVEYVKKRLKEDK